MLEEGPWWLARPTGRRALVSVLACLAVGALVAVVAVRASPLAARALLPLEDVGEHELYLTSLPSDPARVLVTTQRGKSTFTRGLGAQPGANYWIHEYRDPARPALPPRVLLTSRNEGARLLVPAAAIDLERALACASEPADAEGLALRVRMVNVFRDRLFAGAHLELRFPRRARDADGEWSDHALVFVRGNAVRTTDFLLQPSDVLYRAYLAEGRMPQGDFRASAAGELVFALPEDRALPCVPLCAPLSLFEEVALARGDALPELVDDRWRVEELPRWGARAPAPERVLAAAQLLAVHLAARIEDEPERVALARRVAAFTGSAVP